MNADFVTVLWKEWKEIILQRSAGGAGGGDVKLLV